ATICNPHKKMHLAQAYSDCSAPRAGVPLDNSTSLAFGRPGGRPTPSAHQLRRATPGRVVRLMFAWAAGGAWHTTACGLALLRAAITFGNWDKGTVETTGTKRCATIGGTDQLPRSAIMSTSLEYFSNHRRMWHALTYAHQLASARAGSRTSQRTPAAGAGCRRRVRPLPWQWPCSSVLEGYHGR